MPEVIDEVEADIETFIEEIERKHGRRGVRESHAPEHLKLENLPRLSDATDRAIAPAPAVADLGGGIIDWGMFDNDKLGCCGPAATFHLYMAQSVASIVKKAITWVANFVKPTNASVKKWYFGYGEANGEGPTGDQGVDNFTWLTYVYQNQKEIFGPDSEFIFAEIDVTQGPDYVRGVAFDCNGALVAVQLNPEAEQQFDELIPWRIAKNDQPDPQEGHDIALLAWGARPANSQWPEANVPPDADWFVSWGRWQAATSNWYEAAQEGGCVTDAWAFLTRSAAEKRGIDFDAAVALLDTLPHATGQAAA